MVRGLQSKICMTDPAHSLPFADPALAEQATRAVQDARLVYQRTLAAWVGDLLVLRRAGLVEPAWHADHDTGHREAA